METERVLQTMTDTQERKLLCGCGFGSTAAVCDLPQLTIERVPAQREKAVRFASPAAIGCGFDEKTAYEIGSELAKQCCAFGVHVVAVPSFLPFDSAESGARSRSFSSEPALCRALCAAFIDGVQSTGVGAMPAALGENKEELYLAFGGDGKTVCRSRAALFDANTNAAAVAKRAGFDGACVSEWGTVRDRAQALNNGIDLSQPLGLGEEKSLTAAAERGIISKERTAAAAYKAVELIDRTFDDHAYGLNESEQRKKSALFAAECAVLLKNEAVLPLLGDSVTVMGEASKAFFTGDERGGKESRESLVEAFGKDRRVKFIDGYRDGDGGEATVEALEQTFPDETVVVVLCSKYADCVGSERETKLSESGLRLIERLEDSGRNVIAVVVGGGRMDLKRASVAKALIYAPYLGDGGAEALKKLICGELSPSGRLAEDFTFTDKNGEERMLYPFGYGESYCPFSYSKAKLGVFDSKPSVALSVQNDGRYSAGDVIQIYAETAEKKRFLVAFEKVKLRAGERRSLNVVLPQKLLSGVKELLVGTSKEDIREKLVIEEAVENEPTEAKEPQPPTAPDGGYSLCDSVKVLKDARGGKRLSKKIEKLALSSAGGDKMRASRIIRALETLPAGALPSLTRGAVSFKEVKAATLFANKKGFEGFLTLLGFKSKEH